MASFRQSKKADLSKLHPISKGKILVRVAHGMPLGGRNVEKISRFALTPWTIQMGIQVQPQDKSNRQ